MFNFYPDCWKPVSVCGLPIDQIALLRCVVDSMLFNKIHNKSKQVQVEFGPYISYSSLNVWTLSVAGHAQRRGDSHDHETTQLNNAVTNIIIIIIISSSPTLSLAQPFSSITRSTGRRAP